MGRVDLEGEFFVVFYDVVYYVSIVIWVSIYGKYLLIIIRNISDLKNLEMIIRNIDF